MGHSFTELLKARRAIKELEAKIVVLEGRLNPPAPPEIKGVITAQGIINLYGAIFPDNIDKIHIADTKYEITTIFEIRRFVNWSNVNLFEYIPQFHDCDDFALALAGEFAKYPGWSGFPVTFIWGTYHGGHAFATCVAWRSLKERIPTTYFIEPQTDWEIAQESVEGTDLWLLPMKRLRR